MVNIIITPLPCPIFQVLSNSGLCPFSGKYLMTCCAISQENSLLDVYSLFYQVYGITVNVNTYVCRRFQYIYFLFENLQNFTLFVYLYWRYCDIIITTIKWGRPLKVLGHLGLHQGHLVIVDYHHEAFHSSTFDTKTMACSKPCATSVPKSNEPVILI